MHITKRGARGMEITRDESDRRRFPALLFYLNDLFQDANWQLSTRALEPYERPEWWPEQEPLVRILAWALMPNHVHLLIEEIREGGTAKFLQRVFGSMTAHFNAKYSERGSLFQGAYRSRTVSEDAHLRYLAFYIQVKNVLELYPGGFEQAMKNFDDAWAWATSYQSSSLPAFLTLSKSPVADVEPLQALYANSQAFRDEAYEMLANHLEHHKNDESLSPLILEPW